MGGLPLSALRPKSNASSRLLVKFVPGMQAFVFDFARHAADDLGLCLCLSVSLSLCRSVVQKFVFSEMCNGPFERALHTFMPCSAEL